MSGAGVPGRPGRYNRSMSGLVVAMVVTVVLVVAFVGFRALFRAPVDTSVSPIDYLGAVRDLQRSGVDPVYPSALPSGWSAFNLDYSPGPTSTDPPFGLDLHTPDQRYVGIRQATGGLDPLVSQYVDSHATPGAPYQASGGLSDRWQTWSDAGGDHAFGAIVNGQAVLVFGPAPVPDLETVVDHLTTAALPDPAASGPPTPGQPSPAGS